MTIQITVIDPANTPHEELTRVIAFLSVYAGANVASLPVRDLSQGPATIAPEDSPAAGLDIASPATAFGDASATAAFRAASGNGVAPSTPPAGTPPALPNGAQTDGASIQANGLPLLDATGLPWDARIHAGTKSKKTDGTWVAKRGVEAAVVAAVTAELRQLMSLPAAAPGNVPIGAPVTPPAPPVMTPPPPPAPTIAPSAPATIPTATAGAPGMPPAPPVLVVPAATGIDFGTLAMKVGELVANGRLSQDQLQSIVATQGVPSFNLLFNRPDLVPAVHAGIVAIVGA